MTDMNGFINLEENIQTTIYEGLLKLGFENNDCFSIYYDLDLLENLLGVSFDTEEECFRYLLDFKLFAKDRLSDIEISLERKRFKFTVAEDGISYIFKNNASNLFLKELIETVKTHSFNLEDILQVFERYSNDYVCKEIVNSEFQYVIYFTDSTFDKFKYCFTFDQMGGYYHRLLDFSYNKIMQE